jgi:hypothetical protein
MPTVIGGLFYAQNCYSAETTASPKGGVPARLPHDWHVHRWLQVSQVSPNTVYKWREFDDEFVMLERQAKDAFADALEIEAIRRAWHGTKKPVYQNGTLGGYVQEFSDTLLIFALKAIRPDKYRERFDVTTQGQPMIKEVSGDPTQRRRMTQAVLERAA